MAATRTRGTARRSRPTLTPEERAERIATAQAQLDAGIDALVTSDGWQHIIESRRWLSRYSLGNQIMILQQYPDASDVRPLSAWNAAGHRMRKGERQIKIWKPTKRRVTKPEPAAGQTQEAAGKAADAPGAGRGEKVRTGFILVNVVDAGQLDNPPGPAGVALPAELHGDAPAGLWDGVARLVAADGFAVERGDCGTAYGTTNFAARTVRVREGVEPAQAAKTLAHELAHIRMGHDGAMPGQVREVEAESVACIVTAVVGLDSLAYSVPYVAGWAGDRSAVEVSAKRVVEAANRILDDLGIGRGAGSEAPEVDETS